MRYVVLVAPVVIAAGGCIDSTPETPENALFEFVTAAQVGDDAEADSRLCERLRDSPPNANEVTLIDRVVQEGSVRGTGEVEEDGGSAVVGVEVLLGP